MKTLTTNKPNCLPKGFFTSGIASGVKRSGKNDLALIVSEVPAVTAATFTKNAVKAAPLEVTAARLKNDQSQVIMINSGNANCCTGKQGYTDALALSKALAGYIALPEDDILVASTGKIGVPLPMKKMLRAIPQLVDSLDRSSLKATAEGMLTTDVVTKMISVSCVVNGVKVTVTGVAKGSGMIHPNMATMIACVMTDCAVPASLLKKDTRALVGETFNKVTVDGQMSTNDMVTVMANGVAKNKLLTAGSAGHKQFYAALSAVFHYLARIIARDGEGARKFIEVNVVGARTEADAGKVAHSVATSLLVKTAMGAGDPNWGRIAQAVGSSGAKHIDPNKVIIGFYAYVPEKNMPVVKVFTKGMPCTADAAKLRGIMKREYVGIKIDLRLGSSTAFRWTCDLSEEYVRINSKY